MVAGYESGFFPAGFLKQVDWAQVCDERDKRVNTHI